MGEDALPKKSESQRTQRNREITEVEALSSRRRVIEGTAVQDAVGGRDAGVG